jgi:hypothetical protein
MKEVKSEREKPRAVAVEASSRGIVCSLVVSKREMERERERERERDENTQGFSSLSKESFNSVWRQERAG